jgi:hypothetical protein
MGVVVIFQVFVIWLLLTFAGNMLAIWDHINQMDARQKRQALVAVPLVSLTVFAAVGTVMYFWPQVRCWYEGVIYVAPAWAGGHEYALSYWWIVIVTAGATFISSFVAGSVIVGQRARAKSHLAEPVNTCS